VHVPGIYDLEVDTSLMSPEECADAIRGLLVDTTSPTAFERLAASDF
jgi:chloramphenicol 3-O phosphotransferase